MLKQMAAECNNLLTSNDFLRREKKGEKIKIIINQCTLQKHLCTVLPNHSFHVFIHLACGSSDKLGGEGGEKNKHLHPFGFRCLICAPCAVFSIDGLSPRGEISRNGKSQRSSGVMACVSARHPVLSLV